MSHIDVYLYPSKFSKKYLKWYSKKKKKKKNAYNAYEQRPTKIKFHL